MKRVILLSALLIFTPFLSGEYVVVKETPAFWYASMDFEGSYEQIPEKINLFMQGFQKQNLPFVALFGIYFNSPEQVKPEELKWAIGIPVPEKSIVNPPLRKSQFLYKYIAVAIHVGSYEETAKTYGKVFSYINEKGYRVVGPVF